MSNRTELNAKSLHLIPGLAADFDGQIKALVQDCQQRPAIDKPRTLKLEIKVTPHPADPMDVWIEPVLSSKRPSTVIDPLRGQCTRRNQLMFDFSDNELGEYDEAE